MSNQVLLLRAVNVGRRRVPMAELRALLGEAGLRDVRTYLQSGNVVVGSDAEPDELGARCRELISERFGFDVPVLVRTGEELEGVLARDPFGAAATEPKRYWVSFLDQAPEPGALDRLNALATEDERVALHGRELYAWLPAGGGNSKLGAALPNPVRGLTATARNWATVRALADLARE